MSINIIFAKALTQKWKCKREGEKAMKRMKVAAICLAVMMTFTGCGGNNSSGNVSSTSEHETNAKESSQQESVQKNSTAKADTVINIWIAGKMCIRDR